MSNSTGPRIRQLSRADATLFRAIRLDGLEKHPSAFSSSFESERVQPLSRFEELLDRNFVLGADSDDLLSLIGVAGFHVEGTEKTRHRGILWGMHVREEARRSGLARHLIAGLLAHARLHVEEVVLGVEAGNAAAIACYEQSGFSVTTRDSRALKIGATYFDLLQMRIRLAAD